MLIPILYVLYRIAIVIIIKIRYNRGSRNGISDIVKGGIELSKRML